MSSIKKIFLLYLIILISSTANAITYKPIDYTVRLNSEIINSTSFGFKIYWSKTTDSSNFSLRKKHADSSNWTSLLNNSKDTVYYDYNVNDGTAYEYGIINTFDSAMTAHSYIMTGQNIADKSNKKLLFIADETIYSALNKEINNYKLMLKADGYSVRFATAPRSEKFDTNNIRITKNIIDSIYNNFGLDYLILFGRIAVPYAGETAIDGHGDHIGAWPADCYYGIFTNKWTDSLADAYSAADPRNRNVPFDGKIDQSIIEDTVRLKIGRIDFYNLPVYAETEIQLYRRYINKIINYNNVNFTVNKKSLIDDRLGVWFKDIFASEAIANYNAIFENDSIIYDSLQNALGRESFMMSYVCSLGLYDSLEWIMNSNYFAKMESKALIMSFLGSYMGDWDSHNNIIRCSIASSPFTLTANFSGRPYWLYHRLGFGETVGSAYKLSINNDLTQYRTNCIYGLKGMHIALMGDPTVRLFRIAPPNNVIFSRNNGIINISWQYTDDDILGFEIYKSNSDMSAFELISNDYIKDKQFTYNEIIQDSNSIYIIKAVKNQNVVNGSFINRSIGAFANYTMDVDNEEYPDSSLISCYNNIIEIRALTDISRVDIYNIQGNIVYSNTPQSNYFSLIMNNLSKGYLLIRAKIGDKYICKSIINI